jgi:hypothetical protein
MNGFLICNLRCDFNSEAVAGSALADGILNPGAIYVR